MRLIFFGAVMVLVGVSRAEVTCFRTPGQAAVQVGEQEGGGYRLEFVRRDAVGGRSWARVRSCSHPEWPAVLVAAEGTAPVAAAGPGEGAKRTNRMPAVENLVKGGQQVTLMEVQALARIEVAAIAQGSGRMGDTVWVRLLTPAGGDERIMQAVVRGLDLVEVGQ